jgi:hypothetical protein
MCFSGLKNCLCKVATAALCIVLFPGAATGQFLSDSTLFYLSHSTAVPGMSDTIIFSINSLYDVGGFSLILRHERSALNLSGFTLDGTRCEGIPTFVSSFEQPTPDLVTGVVVFSIMHSVSPGDGPMTKLLVNTNPSIRKGSLAPLIFFDEQPGRRNETSEPDGLHFHVPDVIQGSIFFPIDSFPVIDPWSAGDVNLSGIGWEVADYVWTLNRILAITSDADYPQNDLQSALSDVNRDLMPWTIADLRVFEDVILGTAPAPPLPYIPVRSILHLQSDSIWYTGFDGTPVDTLLIPVYFSNSLWAGAVSFRLCYPATALTFVSHSMEGSRIPLSWGIYPGVETTDGFAFVAMPNLYPGTDIDSIPPGSGHLVTLKFAVLHPPETTIPFQFERLQTRGQVNAYATSDEPPMWSLVSLQQIDSRVRFSFIRGDADGSGFIDIDDVVFLIEYVFAGGPAPGIFETGDFNNDFFIDIDDIVALIEFIFG